MQLNDPSDTSLSMKPHDDKLPHDASVFVGRSAATLALRHPGTDRLSSLPSNIDQGELTRLLLDHLSEHTQIKNIKVVRDSKGGVCAFVQCEV
jgi:sulfopyruvate decarboxylase TPP-binding subunit